MTQDSSSSKSVDCNACHNATVTISGDEQEGTRFYVCSKCNKSCDLAVTCDRTFSYGAYTARMVSGIACCPSCKQPIRAHKHVHNILICLYPGNCPNLEEARREFEQKVQSSAITKIVRDDSIKLSSKTSPTPVNNEVESISSNDQLPKLKGSES